MPLTPTIFHHDEHRTIALQDETIYDLLERCFTQDVLLGRDSSNDTTDSSNDTLRRR